MTLSPMNITHVVENLGRGGLERMVIDLVKLQQQQGHHCQVVCLFEHGALAKELEGTDIPVTACHKRRGLDMRALATVRRTVKAHRTDVLHTHNAAAHYLTVLATRGLGVRHVINTRHGMGGMHRWHRAEMLYRTSLLATDTVVTVCEAACRGAVRRGLIPKKMARVIPNGIPIENFSVATPDMRARLLQMLGAPSTARVIGTVGRLNWAKDQAGLIRAYRRVRQQCPDAVLVLIGEGSLRAQLQQCAADEGVADGVHFMGDRGDVRELLRGFDVFVLSSLSEGYSMALLEACAAGLPVVATDVGGNREIVRDGVNGRLVPASDPAALSAALVDLLSDPSRTAGMGRAAREWVEASGSLQAMAARYEALYRERA